MENQRLTTNPNAPENTKSSSILKFASPHTVAHEWLNRAVCELLFFARFWVWSLFGLYCDFFWSLRRENGFFAALRFLFVKGQRFCDCLTCPRLCFLEHMTVNVARIQHPKRSHKSNSSIKPRNQAVSSSLSTTRYFLCGSGFSSNL